MTTQTVVGVERDGDWNIVQANAYHNHAVATSNSMGGFIILLIIVLIWKKRD